MERAGTILRRECADLIVSKRKLKHVEACQLVRERRDSAKQNLGFASRPFVLCALPIKRPPAGTLLHQRRNGDFLLEVTGHPRYGLPWGQDRLVPLLLATLAVRQRSQTILFPSAAAMLETFGMHQGGYRDLSARSSACSAQRSSSGRTVNGSGPRCSTSHASTS